MMISREEFIKKIEALEQKIASERSELKAKEELAFMEIGINHKINLIL